MLSMLNFAASIICHVAIDYATPMQLAPLAIDLVFFSHVLNELLISKLLDSYAHARPGQMTLLRCVRYFCFRRCFFLFQ